MVDKHRQPSSTGGSSPKMLETADQTEKRHHHAGLLAIAVMKILKAIFFLAVGIGVLRLLHKDLADLATRMAIALKFDTEGHFVSKVLDHIQLITPRQLKQISVASIVYAGIATTEGLGLYYEKTWAEYLTIILTASFLPWELIELIHHLNWTRGVVIIVNIVVLAYLLWYVQRMRKQQSVGSAHQIPTGTE